MSNTMHENTDRIAVSKYAGSIIRWGRLFRNILTVFAWINLIGGPIIGYLSWYNSYLGEATYFFLGVLLGGFGAIIMFGYRLIFDCLLMKAHQSKL